MVQELFPSRVRVPGTNVIVNPNLARNIMSMRKPTAEIFNGMERKNQSQYLVDEGIASLDSDLEVHFLRSYTNGNGLETLSTQDLIKCIGYISSEGDLQQTIQRDLFENIGFEKLQRLESYLKAYKN